MERIEGRISELEDRVIEITQYEQISLKPRKRREKRKKRGREAKKEGKKEGGMEGGRKEGRK